MTLSMSSGSPVTFDAQYRLGVPHLAYLTMGVHLVTCRPLPCTRPSRALWRGMTSTTPTADAFSSVSPPVCHPMPRYRRTRELGVGVAFVPLHALTSPHPTATVERGSMST